MSDRPEIAMALARAWDHEEAASMGEPSPWDVGQDAPDYVGFCAERLAIANAVLESLADAGIRVEMVAP